MRAVGPVVEVHRQVGSEPPQLASPVAEHRCRAHDQRRRIRLVGAIQQVGDQLHRLAQTHVVGQQRAQAQPAHAHQPAQSALLVGPQHAVEPLAGLDRPAQPGVAQLRGQLLELRRARRIDLHVEPAQLGPPRQRRSQSRQRRDAGRVQRQLRQLPRPPQRLVAEQRPLAADAHQRLGGGGQGTELLVADLPAAQRGVQVVLDDAAQRQRPGCKRQPSLAPAPAPPSGGARRGGAPMRPRTRARERPPAGRRPAPASARRGRPRIRDSAGRMLAARPIRPGSIGVTCSGQLPPGSAGSCSTSSSGSSERRRFTTGATAPRSGATVRSAGCSTERSIASWWLSGAVSCRGSRTAAASARIEARTNCSTADTALTVEGSSP